MSLLKKLFLTGSLLAAVLVTVVPAPAQEWDARLWKPYQPEQFGGQRRSKDGFYAGLEAIVWKMDAPKQIFNKTTTGMTEDGRSLEISSGNSGGFTKTDFYASQVPYDFGLGTRFMVGNRRGHHGWRFTGYGIENTGSLREPDRWQWRWIGNEDVEILNTSTTSSTWTYRRYVQYDYMILVNDFKTYYASTKVFDADLVWTYRPHPFSWGELEFFAGVKYHQVDDRLIFNTISSENRNGNTIIYGYRNAETLTSSSSATTAGTSGVTPVTLHIGEELAFQAKNRVVGPVLGFELSRRNSRWTFGATPSLILGINNQSFTYREGTQVEFEPPEEVYQLTRAQLRALQYAQGTLTSLQATTVYRKYRTVFSPGGSLQLSAKWQWTDAIAVKVAFDASCVGNIARGSDLVAVPTMKHNGWRSEEVPVLGPDGLPIIETQFLNEEGEMEYTYKTETQTVEVLERSGENTYKLRSKGETFLMYGITVGLEFRR